jgi:hypothetical protein
LKAAVMLGISDGTVKVLSFPALVQIVVIDVRKEIDRAVAIRSTNAEDLDMSTLQCPIVVAQAWGSLLNFAAPMALVTLTRESFSLVEVDVFETAGAVTSLSITSGTRIFWFPFTGCIRAQSRITDVAAALQQAKALEESDLVHARRPLPDALSRPLVLNRAAPDPKTSKPVT